MNARAMWILGLALLLPLTDIAAGRVQDATDVTMASPPSAEPAPTPLVEPAGDDPAPEEMEAILAVGWSRDDSPVYRLRESTAEFELIGYSGFKNLNSLARDRDGTFYSAESRTGSVATLITIDPVTGAGKPAVGLHLEKWGRIDIRALAFSPAGTLYAVLLDPSKLFATDNCCLYTIDTSTGLLSLVGQLGARKIQSLAFSPDGVLYGWDFDRGLVTIDPETADTVDVNEADSGRLPGPLNNTIQSLAFSQDGRLIGLSGDTNGVVGHLNQIRDVDPTSGATTLLSSTSMPHSIRGIEYLVPPPISVAIDVKPGNPWNDVNPSARGFLRVALLGDDLFDVGQVDLATLALGPGAAPPSSTYVVQVHDVNLDGHPDLDLHFRMEAAGVSCDERSLALKGRLQNGARFIGSDTIRPTCWNSER